jgi:hypothetical protein
MAIESLNGRVLCPELRSLAQRMTPLWFWFPGLIVLLPARMLADD